ncbi:MAG: type IV pilus secretin PilQ [Deltaproteobacteria bacterium]|nr:MAG: type IV pilus secretin PilQ [Deltaproteobacteria bacterium]
MKRAIQSMWLVFFMLLMTAAPPAWGAPPTGPDAIGQTVNAGYLENVAFEKLPGKERVILTVSKLSEVTVENPPGNAVGVPLDALFVPAGLRRSHEEPSLADVVRIAPVQKTGDGRSWVLATIELRQKVPYSVRSEGMNVLIDFNVTSLASAAAPAPERTLPLRLPGVRQEELQAETPATPAKDAAGDAGRVKQAQTGSRISLDVQDADIKSVFRLLAEQGNVSIVYGDDVKGTVTLSIKNVPWNQALDTVLGIKGLSRIDKDDIITVMSTDNFLKLKKTEEELVKKAEEEQARRERRQLDAEPLITRIVHIKYRLLQFIKKIEMKRDVLISGASKESAAGAGSLKAPLLDDKMDLSADVSGQQKKDAKAAGYRDETASKKVSMEGAGDFIQLLQSLLSTDADGKQRGWIGADADTNSIIITAVKRDLYSIMDMIAKMDIPTDQILIKANIVETTKNTARNLGIQWGGVFGQKAGNQSLYLTPGGAGGSAVPPGYVFSGVNPISPTLGYSPASGVSGLSGQGYGVNFPAAPILGVGPASLGLLFGTIGGNILDLQLSALQSDGKLNILSSPSLVTLDNQMASTENGEEIPYVTPATATSPATVTWKKAVLRLEITPHVIDQKNIKMTIVVKKDEPNYLVVTPGGNPIIVKETKTDLVVADGETIVISGLTKQRGYKGDSGVPWFKDIPFLGWLFKGEGKTEDMEEVLIFITPNIMKTQEVAGIQTGP